MKPHVFLYFLFLMVVLPFRLFGQNIIGAPDIIYYDNEDFNAGAQTWMMGQDKFGIMYLGNADGLVTYNGKEWKIYPLPNKTLIRSVKIDNDGKIYVGGQDEFGYFFPDKKGDLAYHSLTNLFPAEDQTFGDVWNISIIGKDIFIRCANEIFHIRPDKKTEVFKSSTHWLYMADVNGKIYAQDQSAGLLEYRNGQWILLTRAVLNTIITGVLPMNTGNLLVATLKNGAFVFSEKGQLSSLPVDSKIIGDHIYTTCKINSNEYALGTTSGGVYFIDNQGKTTRHLSHNLGLQNNNILSMFLDKDKNLWLGLDKGINKVSINSAIQKILPVDGAPAACYTACIFDHKIYIGTSDGLYSSPLTLPENEDLSFSDGNFSRVENSGGQVWSLFNTKHQLLMGHTDGAFTIKNNKAIPIFKGTGAWLFKNLPSANTHENNLLTGTYFGLNRLTNINEQVSDSGQVKNSINESFRFLEIDSLHHVVWSAHPYHGIYKISMNSSMDTVISTKLYTQKNGLPNSLNNYVYSINRQIVFCTDSGLYRYDAQYDNFVKDKQYQNIFGNMPLRSVTEDDSGNIWFVSKKKLGVALKDGHIRYFPEVTGKLIAGFEYVYPLNQQNIFVGSSNGMIHINFEKYRQHHDGMGLVFNKIIAIGKKDSLLFNGYFSTGDSIYETQQKNNIATLPASFSSIHVEFTSPEYTLHNNVQYSFLLEGFDRNWSTWNARSEKDYTNLPYGKYIFRVKAKDNFNNESKEQEYTFIISPHWYQTILAYLLYIAATVVFVLLLGKYQSRKFDKQRLKYEEEQKQLQYLHQLELEHNEREIIQLQKEKLENEVTYKNKELALTTMHLFKRGKLLSKIKEELVDSVKDIPPKERSSELMKLIKMLNEAEKQDNDWEQFAVHFDDVHNNFLQNLKHAYPNLTQADLRICAYLKMNLSSKEIAQLLNISLKSVEIARYRLRKKLSITDSNVNLYDFLVETK
ncbi:hypothetical protein A9P82_07980 [Arachidicoccus ginsenosidimutans]|uniref:triple tyrosine motif-containing protein n=1 Tax=Arachidicoccus sp. BS20 TaxID=1850526 RepID=UPI0007F0CE85|nr:triple tyrosine motif-containing protein [Arachidicoccus sp. BS20]ANI90683.1 hypothetical protein A9P82_07980 [Arachidicoccus sp. BS20]